MGLRADRVAAGRMTCRPVKRNHSMHWERSLPYPHKHGVWLLNTCVRVLQLQKQQTPKRFNVGLKHRRFLSQNRAQPWGNCFLKLLASNSTGTSSPHQGPTRKPQHCCHSSGRGFWARDRVLHYPYRPEISKELSSHQPIPSSSQGSQSLASTSGTLPLEL